MIGGGLERRGQADQEQEELGGHGSDGEEGRPSPSCRPGHSEGSAGAGLQGGGGGQGGGPAPPARHLLLLLTPGGEDL